VARLLLLLPVIVKTTTAFSSIVTTQFATYDYSSAHNVHKTFFYESPNEE
jgi:hypothetical protein